MLPNYLFLCELCPCQRRIVLPAWKRLLLKGLVRKRCSVETTRNDQTRDLRGSIGGWFAGQSPQTRTRETTISKQGGNSSQYWVQASGFQDSFMHGPFHAYFVWLAHCNPPLLADGIGLLYRTLCQVLARVFVRFFRPSFRLAGARSLSSPVLASWFQFLNIHPSIRTIQIYLFYNFEIFEEKCLAQTFALHPP